MPLPLIPLVPLAIASLAGGAWWVKKGRAKQVDPAIQAERAVIFDTAINSPLDSSKLRELAEAYRKVGLTAEADMLVKRANLADASPELKAARKEALRKGLASTDPVAVRNLADAFENEGAVGAAASLRKYADSLQIITTEQVTP